MQGYLRPDQIISLMKYDDTDNTLAMGDHADHIHVGFRPQFDANTKAGRTYEARLFFLNASAIPSAACSTPDLNGVSGSLPNGVLPPNVICPTAICWK